MAKVKVEFQDIALAFGKTEVLRNISLAIEPGEFFALLGPSGSGKSTLLRVIAGFARAQSGRVLVDGKDISAVPPWKRDIGMVFQNYALWPHMTVQDNVAFGLEERKFPRDEVKRKVAAALAMVGLPNSPRAGRANSPAASSSALPSRAPSPSNRRCGCWTCRCRISTPSCGCTCASSCWRCSASSA